jgi:hypothetical protein
VRHRASPRFWACYGALPADVRELADRSYALLRQDPRHPSLHFKKVGRLWSVRVGLHYRALAVEQAGDMVCSGLVRTPSTTTWSAEPDPALRTRRELTARPPRAARLRRVARSICRRSGRFFAGGSHDAILAASRHHHLHHLFVRRQHVRRPEAAAPAEGLNRATSASLETIRFTWASLFLRQTGLRPSRRRRKSTANGKCRQSEVRPSTPQRVRGVRPEA